MKPLRSVFFAVFLAFLLGSSATATDISPPAASSANDAQMLEWQTSRKSLDKAYHVCTEHCGASTTCEQKCSKARTAGMNKEHMRLFGKPMPKTGQGGL